MAYGPCGEQFRAAFSCFVFSKEEPKGVDCIENFKNMQNCFREHPDVYGAELDDDDEAPADEVEGQATPAPSEPTAQLQSTSTESSSNQTKKASEAGGQSGRVADSVVVKRDPQPASEEVIMRHHQKSEDDEAVPKAWHDSRDSSQST